MKQLLSISFLLASSAFANGGEVGNGGQRVALEFSTMGFDVIGKFSRYFQRDSSICHDASIGHLCDLNLEALRSAVQLSRVVAMPELVQQDPETGKILTYSALNFPQEHRILVSEAEWDKPTLCSVKKMPLVLHEYLGLLGIEIQNYNYSSAFAVWLARTADAEKFQGCPELKETGE